MALQWRRHTRRSLTSMLQRDGKSSIPMPRPIPTQRRAWLGDSGYFVGITGTQRNESLSIRSKQT